jgi:putative transposase
MIDRTHALPVKRQAELVGISRGTVYYQLGALSDAELRLMRRIDELHLELPFAGSRMLRDLLNGEGFAVGRRHVTTLMRRMGIEALYRKPNMSKKHPRHPVFPYLLRGLTIERANQVWAMDISAPWRRGLQRQEKGERYVSEPSWLIHDRQLRCCLAPVGAGRKGAAKLGRLPTAGCHAQSSLNCTERGLRAAGRATTGSMVRQRSGRRTPLYSATSRPRDGHRGVIRLGLMFPSGECARAHSAMDSPLSHRPEPPGVELAT